MDRDSRCGLASAVLVLSLALVASSASYGADSSAGASEHAAEGAAAESAVNQLHAAFLDVMKNASELGFEGRERVLAGVVEQAFDLEFMALKAIGEGRRQLDAGGRARWVACFGSFVLANYARRFDGYSGQSFETISFEEAPRNTIVVHTRLLRPKDKDVKLDYRLRETSSGWRVIDVYSNGNVSELALRRSEFSSLFRDVGLDRLIASVDERAARR